MRGPGSATEIGQGPSVQSLTTSAPAVLVIDDDVALLHSFESVREAYGIPIATVRNAHDGLAVFRWSFDVDECVKLLRTFLRAAGSQAA